jgi:hypothetical protein
MLGAGRKCKDKLNLEGFGRGKLNPILKIYKHVNLYS